MCMANRVRGEELGGGARGPAGVCLQQGHGLLLWEVPEL